MLMGQLCKTTIGGKTVLVTFLGYDAGDARVMVVETRRTMFVPPDEGVIHTDGEGRPLPERPKREDFVSDVDFARAVHDYNTAVTNAHNRAFDKAFRAEMRRSKGSRRRGR